MPTPQIAIYAGSFDPPTNGHLDLVQRAASLFPKLIVALGKHPSRTALFSVEERIHLLQEICRPFHNVEIGSFGGLLVTFARERQARVIVRGLRAITDFEYELQIAHANGDLANDIDTIFLPTRVRHGFISASLVREIASHGGTVERYAPPIVCEALKMKFQQPSVE